MRIKLADVGDIAPIFGPRADVRARSLRRQASGEGGGGADDGSADDKDDADDDSTEDDKNDADDDSEEDDQGDKKTTVPKTELDKAIKRRDTALARARKAEEALAKKRQKDEDKTDPVAEANAKIVRTSAHGILRGLGVEDKADRATVLDLLRLDDIDVDSDGADEDAIEERIDDLRRILGAGVKPTKRIPRGVDPKDKGGKETKTDPDASRYRRILGRK